MATRYAFNVKTVVMEVREPTGPKVSTARAVFDAMKDVATFAQEAFFVLTLDGRERIIDKYMISLGTRTGSLIHPREVFRPAILDAATGVICVHNHPSGNPEPSAQDRDLTQRLCDAAKILGFQLLDHVIIGRDGFYSFTERGLL